MSDLIHKIVGKIIEVGQSDTKKFRLGETIRYSPSEILEILKQHENEIFGEDPSTQPNASNTLNTLDTIYRQAAIDAIKHHAEIENDYTDIYHGGYCDGIFDAVDVLVDLPSAQPEQLTDKEQRIFLAAMGREEKVCKQVDAECRDCRESYEDSLVRVCHEIIRKVKATLWET